MPLQKQRQRKDAVTVNKEICNSFIRRLHCLCTLWGCWAVQDLLLCSLQCNLTKDSKLKRDVEVMYDGWRSCSFFGLSWGEEHLRTSREIICFVPNIRSADHQINSQLHKPTTQQRLVKISPENGWTHSSTNLSVV